MLPAAAAGVISLPPWGVAASLLLPYGILLMSLAVYAFARVRLGAAAATIAPAALLLVPDASTYGMRNGFFGFHWLLFTAPGSGYGLSAAFTALTLMVIWRSHHRSACLWLGICVTAAAFEFRAQIFLLLAPALAASLLCETAFVRRHARAVTLAVALAAITVTICLVTGTARVTPGCDSQRSARFWNVAHSAGCPDRLRWRLHSYRPALRAAGRDDARRARAHPGCAGRAGTGAADRRRRSDTTHRLARPRYVSALVCRGVARRGAARADGQPR